MRVSDQRGVQLNLYVADTFFRRLRGLFSSRAKKHDGLLIKPCNSVHTFFMSKEIDVFFISNKGVVIKVVKSLGTNRVSICQGAAYVLEVFSGLSDFDLKVGEELHVL